MPFYLLCNKQGIGIDIIHQKNYNDASRFNDASGLCIELGDIAFDQLRLQEEDMKICEIIGYLEIACINLIRDYQLINKIEEPLDGDEVEELGKIVVLFIQHHEGNITDDEYKKAIYKDYRHLC